MESLNSTDQSGAIIPLPDATLATEGPEAGTVLAKMVGETLALARRVPLFRIGEYEWCEPDYRQILLWAEQLDLEPEEVIRRLLDKRSAKPLPPDMRAVIREAGLDPDVVDGADWRLFGMFPATVLRDGRIMTLNWDCDLLPLSEFRWVSDLEIKCLRIIPGDFPSRTPSDLNLILPTLTTLCCENLGIRELDLSKVPSLEDLRCSFNQLKSLDLSNVPLLTELFCNSNALTELDLSHTPRITALGCFDNKLSALSLSRLSDLTWLACGQNSLNTLDLSSVSELRELYCNDNCLRRLDISQCVQLESLDCKGNLIERLYVEGTPLDDNRLRFDCDGWVYVEGRNGGSGGEGLFPEWLFEQLHSDKTQPEAAYSDYENYLRRKKPFEYRARKPWD